MADFEKVLGIRGPKLSDLAEYVTDVLAITLLEEDEYQVGKLSLASYDFVPYALTGLSAAMQTPATGARATTHVTLPISDDAGGSATAEQDVTLFGPGEVIGVDPGQIVRRYPSPGSTNAEETFHAHIEFDRPELPWAFSARTPGDQMPAWLALVALETTEIAWEPSQAGLLPVMAVEAALLPPLNEAWAWAHAQAAGGSAALTARLSTAFAPVNVSRLLAARVFTQNTNYTACLVPTTEAGRNAGLGVPGGGLGPAWTAGDGIVRLPVYDRWAFRTAPDGDFARLARRLKGVPAPWAIGRRIMDASRPGRPLDDLAAGESGDRQVIRCALFSPNPPPPGVPSDTAAWNAARTADLKAEVERPALIEGTAGSDPGNVPLLPIVGPRLYAKGQRGTGTVPAGDWFAELNLAPTHRVVGGLGTRVVIKDQEPLMQSAWAQVGEIDKANRQLALAELARNLAKALHTRLAKVDPGRLLQVTRPIAARVRLDGNALTLAGQTVRSATPVAALGGSFRRAVRATGPLARRLTGAERSTIVRLVADESGARDFTRPYAELDGIGGLSPTAIESLDARAVAVALGVPTTDAIAKVKSSAEMLGQASSLATAVTKPELWKTPEAGFRPGAVVTERIAAQVRERVPTDPGSDIVRARSIGSLAAGLAVTSVEGTSDFGEVALRLESAVMATAPRSTVGAGAATRVLEQSAPARDMRAAVLRGQAGRGLPVPSGLSPTAAGRVSGSIVRPVNPVEGGEAVALSDRERLDRFRTSDGTNLSTWIERANRVTVADVRAGLKALVESPGALSLTMTPARSVLAVKSGDLLERLDPSRTVVGAIRARVHTGLFAFDPFLLDLIRPIMAAPRFDRPMYQALDAYDREWLVPGLGTLPEPELVTLLESNDAFTEAFLVGLSDEMGRELLWRNYPTDSRGTYFHRFWDPNHDELTQPIHRFSKTRLGSHVSIGPNQQSGRAVVVIRGELVRRYPDLTVMALKESGRDPDTNHPWLPEAPKGMPDAAPSLFHAMLPPDIMLAGLDITVAELRQGGWWIVVAEHPQATRFRRREADLADHEVRFAKPGAFPNAAAVAKDRLENPTRVAFEAGDFLPKAT